MLGKLRWGSAAFSQQFIFSLFPSIAFSSIIYIFIFDVVSFPFPFQFPFIYISIAGGEFEANG
ncbi:uncharacterized protein BO88DRAFT_186306 [Aspergillus vadensis CBS 113365]|uniref:Uncharacterized protein n=1 Tax=Aspergillus vadensis (strain CBS 113365 / IMI 142717 / IBT 24658) TaxID=1448311 RepID=A0A319BL42_ASPVC|nr:hypothetical protein BO88DRAFT_186306 [Aspergillus vadensis CBS 113365]PYH64028.1 hypothetical protein BO88DRAFT_186306 [Aspergillus vadensis CBS 113365]